MFEPGTAEGICSAVGRKRTRKEAEQALYRLLCLFVVRSSVQSMLWLYATATGSLLRRLLRLGLASGSTGSVLSPVSTEVLCSVSSSWYVVTFSLLTVSWIVMTGGHDHAAAEDIRRIVREIAPQVFADL